MEGALSYILEAYVILSGTQWRRSISYEILHFVQNDSGLVTAAMFYSFYY